MGKNGKGKKKSASSSSTSGPPKPTLVDLEDGEEMEPKIVELPDSDEEIQEAPPPPPPPRKQEKKKESTKPTKSPVQESPTASQSQATSKPTRNETIHTEPEIKVEKKDKVSDASKPKPAEIKPTETPTPQPPIQDDAKAASTATTEVPTKPKPQGNCVVCGHTARNFCSSCKRVFYCTRDHQKKHWKDHKEECKEVARLPFRVEKNSRLGRHLVAMVDIPAGTLILNELPMVVGPRQLTKPVCLGCHAELKSDVRRHTCSRCQWPLCSAKCEDSKYHEPECRIIRYGGSKVQVEAFGQYNMMYACITVLRALALQDGPCKVWQDYTDFDSHLEQRMKTEVYTKVNKEKVVMFMHHYLRLLTKYSDLEILEACGKLDTNCFEVRQGGLNLRAMYRTACLMSHDCTPNTKHTFRSEDYAISLYATVPIAKGSVISATYTQTLWSTINRREHLWTSKCFWCDCARCADPTELGADSSAIRCTDCQGLVRSAAPLDDKSDWKCEKCPFTCSVKEVKSLMEKQRDEIKSLDRADPSQLESFLQRTPLPETNQLVREVQYGLVCLYKVDDLSLLSNQQLLRKSFLCKQLADLADRVDPGMSKLRGELLFEMQSASVLLAQRALADGRITAYQAKEIFAENFVHLQEAVSILEVETDGSREDLQKQMRKLSKSMEDVDRQLMEDN